MSADDIIMVPLRRDDVEFCVTRGVAVAADMRCQRIDSACKAALPAPIEWETHLGVEMARVGDRMAMNLAPGDFASYRCTVDPSLAHTGWLTKAEAEQWLRGGK